MNWLAIAVSALAAWGWSGMTILITLTAPGNVYAQSHPDSHFSACRIDVNTTLLVDEHTTFLVFEHEIGHCIGYYNFAWGDHSLNPVSIMYAGYQPGGTILDEDLLNVKTRRDAVLTRAHIVVPSIAR